MNNLLEIKDLSVHFQVPGSRGILKAVDGISFNVERGKTFGLVGESGCGKSTTGFALLQLIKPTFGQIIFDGIHLNQLSLSSLRPIRRKLQIIFQDAHASLNPRMSIGEIVGEALDIHKLYQGKIRGKRIYELLDMVGLASHLITRFPHELSGGQAQRVAICRALAVEPELIVCDEPVSALDVSIQAQIINLLKDLQEKFNLTYIFISHDLSVVRHMSDRVAVMYLGNIIELADKNDIYFSAAHPYTQALLSAVPVIDPDAHLQRVILSGDLPNPLNPPSGCRFRTRCPVAIPRCEETVPPEILINPHHWAKCIKLNQAT